MINNRLLPLFLALLSLACFMMSELIKNRRIKALEAKCLTQINKEAVED